MERLSLRDQEGQTLVLVALALVVLMGIAALAIDGGRLYSERRYMQNAADAGALAGARELCFGANPTQASAESAAAEYATIRNLHNTSQSSFQYADMASYTVAVTTTASVGMTFAGVLGFSTVQVQARARAACGATLTACSLWPIAFPKAQWDPMKNACGQRFYVWQAYNANDDAPDCSRCDCDLDKTRPGPELLSESGRAWVDFATVANDTSVYPVNCGSGGCGGSALQCWTRDNFQGQVVIPPGGLCVDGDANARPGLRDEINSRLGAAVSVPIYNGSCGGASCSEGYNIVDLGCVKVGGWVHDLALNDLPGQTCNVSTTKVVEVEVACNACSTSCGKTDGSHPPTGEAGVRSVSLIE